MIGISYYKDLEADSNSVNWELFGKISGTILQRY
jgi:hypothetical protein